MVDVNLFFSVSDMSSVALVVYFLACRGGPIHLIVVILIFSQILKTDFYTLLIYGMLG